MPSATPTVAGVCALVVSANPSLSGLEVRQLLQQTADTINDGDDEDTNVTPTRQNYPRVNAYKAALMLELCGLDWQPRKVDFFGGETRTPEYRQSVNEMGEVPVLEHGDVRLTQSGVILDYLSEQTGRFRARNDEERREIWRWILYDNHKFNGYFGPLRFLLRFAKTGETPVTEFLRGRAVTGLGIVAGICLV